MAAPHPRRYSTSPEEGSEGNDSHSAPSEYLSEFLSAIMQRQYAEALKFCRLILQYEPHNATARGFYPLLQQKLGLARAAAAAEARDDSSEAEGASAPPARRRSSSSSHGAEEMQVGADESSSRGSQSSLSLDSSVELGASSPSGSGSASPALRPRTASPGHLALCTRSSGSSPASGQGWLSTTTGTGSASRSDDNGNAPPTHNHRNQPAGDENDNDNVGGDHGPHLKSESESLQRLRAQFACSIK